MSLDHNLQPYNEHEHAAILYAAALEDTDIAPLPGGVRYIGYGDTAHGYGPACIVDDTGTNYMAEPHVTWFPWTTKANRIVNFKWAMSHLAETRQVLLTVEKSQIKFFEHFVKRGILRKVGHLEDIPEVDEIHMYQYRKDKS